ncbi:unnamed protein product [Pipistrellus nathusii]|uniref:Centriole, cilia and spindle-associated protein n=1 Tax=Pipistrellus nathusii TaxID=59473 RepID=A0ABN9ZVZ6_PIPNA
MSPGCGAKSEYMKRYRDPRWAEYAACYRELLHYRRGRRLLEQAHAPWLWDAWGPAGSSDDSASSASSCAGSPAPRAASASPPPPPAEGPARGARGSREEPAAKPGDAEAGDAEDTPVPEAPPVKGVKEKPEEEAGMAGTDRAPGCTRPRQHPSALFARRDRKAARSPARSPSRTRETKHPFALYGWGERRTDTGGQRTHNVCASAPVHEIHESALRARTRRQVERRRLAAQRQRAHSVDAEKGRRPAPAAPDSPWVTEYMRCYSARA